MLEKLNARVARMNVVDIGLVKFTVFFGTMIIVKLFPQFLELGYPVLIIAFILCAIKPMYTFWKP
jgi:hypothetical protein